MQSTQRSRQPRFGFVMEQTLGHVTHYKNLRAAVDATPDVSATWYPLAFPPLSGMETLPPVRNNWSIRASLRARRVVQGDLPHFDALFFHTQVTTLLSVSHMRRVPTVISLDATPRNYDVVGAAYGHSAASATAEVLKLAINRRSLRAAHALVTWCNWARQSLITDYGLDAERISVIAPGVNLSLWPQPSPRATDGPVRILFVGADFKRKGGDLLLAAFDRLRPRCELHLVTKAAVQPGHGIYVYSDLAPNSPTLRQLYATADLFVLPTRADCFPLVIQEAMAAGLPVIATDVGAVGEAVQHGETGLLVQPDDGQALGQALGMLAEDGPRRRLMGLRGRLLAEQRYDCGKNAQQILSILTAIASAHPGTYPAAPELVHHG